MNQQTYDMVMTVVEKGDVIGVARLAGIMVQSTGCTLLYLAFLKSRSI